MENSLKKIIIALWTAFLSGSGYAMEPANLLDPHRILIFEGVSNEGETNIDLTAELIPWSGEAQIHDTKNKFGMSALHGYIMPQFVDALFSKPNLEVLEVGPADGLLLKLILEDERNLKTPIRYTVVEPCAEHLAAINQIKKQYSKNPQNWIGQAKNGDVREFIKGKENKYDLILCSQVLHYFDPMDQLEILQGFQKSLKEIGRLFLITSSLFSINIWVDNNSFQERQEKQNIYIKKIKLLQSQGDLWPGYNFDNGFTSTKIVIKKEASLPYDLPHFHSATSFQALLKAVGFDVEKCCNFTEKLPQSVQQQNLVLPSARLGAMARKGVPNNDMIGIYKKQALKKRQEKESWEQMIKDHYNEIMLMSQMVSAAQGTPIKVPSKK